MNRSWKLIPIVALAISLIIPASAPAAEDKESFFPASVPREMDERLFPLEKQLDLISLRLVRQEESLLVPQRRIQIATLMMLNGVLKPFWLRLF